jgi:imidazolonepropionase-like amidohydrolase
VDGGTAARLGIDELHNSSRIFFSRDYPVGELLSYTSIADRLALSGRAWATIDWAATAAIMEAMVQAGTAYCGMQIITQFQLGEGAAELESDAGFKSLFTETDRQTFRDFIGLLQSSWSDEDFRYWRVANDNRMEWMRRFREMGGTLLTGTDMQFGGIMLHLELRNLTRLGMSAMEAIAAATGGNARALRRGDIGTIEKGRLADIVVLNRSPTADLDALRDIHSVLIGGVVRWQLAGAAARVRHSVEA